MIGEGETVAVFEILFGIAIVILNGVLFLFLKNTKADHVRISSELSSLKVDVSALKANEMTESKVKTIMHDQIEPIIKSLDKIETKVENVTQEVIWGIKEQISQLDNETSVIRARMEYENAGKKERKQ